MLDTGGGIARASWFFGNEPFLVYNVDIQSNIDLKNDSGTVIRTYTITTNQVLHLQKAATTTNTNVIDQFENAISNLIVMAKSINKSMWLGDNGAYVEEQSRQ